MYSLSPAHAVKFLPSCRTGDHPTARARQTQRATPPRASVIAPPLRLPRPEGSAGAEELADRGRRGEAHEACAEVLLNAVREREQRLAQVGL
jgi:hypothetical protein